MRTEAIAAWVNEREAIRMRKDVLLHDPCTTHPADSGVGRRIWGTDKQGKLLPANHWQLDRLTNDSIMQKFRFCNVQRERDSVTRWVRQYIIEPYAGHENLWLMLAIARTINWPRTLGYLMNQHTAAVPRQSWPYDNRFSPRDMGDSLQLWKFMGEKVYTGAYMISAESDKTVPWYSWTKQRYIAEIVIGKLWEARKEIGFELERKDVKSWEIWKFLTEFRGWGPFMAYQTVVDLQHTRYLCGAPDVQTWAAAGPGTLRGLLRWRDGSINGRLGQEEALALLIQLREELNAPGAIWEWLQPLDLSDICNIACEFDKWCRVKFGEGRPRALYVPGRGH